MAKEGLGNLIAITMAILLAAIVVITGLLIFSGLDSNLRTSSTEINSTDINITLVNGTAVSIAPLDLPVTNIGACVLSSNGTLLTLGAGEDYTTAITDTAATITLVENAYTTENAWCTYTYGKDTSASNSAETSITALATIPGWFTILITISIAAILIGIVVTSFIFGGKR